MVEYVVLQFGGLFGMGSDYYPIPWNILSYNKKKDGYMVDLDKSVLENAPRYSPDSEPSYDDEYGRKVYGHYGLTYPS